MMTRSALAVVAILVSLASACAAAASEHSQSVVEHLAEDVNARLLEHTSTQHDKAESPPDASRLLADTRASDASSEQPQTGRLGKRTCGTQPLTAAEMTMEGEQFSTAARLMNAEESEARSLGTGGLGQRESYGSLVKQVKVYWHVIHTGSSVSQGKVPRSFITAQMSVLNQKYSKANIHFNLAGVDYTQNKNWFNIRQGTAADEAMRRKLHRGSMQDINVYTAEPRDATGALIAGYTKMPQFAQAQPVLDGSVILHSTLPGGSEVKFNLGLTLVHEVGHAFSLLHPFDHGCSFPGDGVGDTVYQREAIFECVPQKTCKNRPGKTDPIHNPMGYAPDACMTTFTEMQLKKIRKAYYAYRYPVS